MEPYAQATLNQNLFDHVCYVVVAPIVIFGIPETLSGILVFIYHLYPWNILTYIFFVISIWYLPLISRDLPIIRCFSRPIILNLGSWPWLRLWSVKEIDYASHMICHHLMTLIRIIDHVGENYPNSSGENNDNFMVTLINLLSKGYKDVVLNDGSVWEYSPSLVIKYYCSQEA